MILATLPDFFQTLSDNWNALHLFSKIFYAVGGIALCIVFIQGVLTLVGIGDVDADVPADTMSVDAVHDAGIGLISVRSLTAFFMGFGLGAGAIFDKTQSFATALAGGFVVGLVLMFIIFKIMKMFYGLRASGNIDPQSAVGSTGTVYVAIPPNNATGGQVEITVSGRLMTFQAVSKSAEKIPAGTLVKVNEVLPSNIMVVEKK